jgi:uncharacterized protein (TIGR02271 family)
MKEEHLDESISVVEAKDPHAKEIVVPLLEEDFSVSKRLVEKSRVRVRRTTREQEQLVDEILAREHVEVERIAIDKQITSMPDVREDGDTIIIPVVEEILVLERRLVLKEEVHVRRVRGTERYREQVSLRKHEAVVTREAIANSPGEGAGENFSTVKKENL